jgi:hypothetical protein
VPPDISIETCRNPVDTLPVFLDGQFKEALIAGRGVGLAPEVCAYNMFREALVRDVGTPLIGITCRQGHHSAFLVQVKFER